MLRVPGMHIYTRAAEATCPTPDAGKTSQAAFLLAAAWRIAPESQITASVSLL